MKPFGLPSVEHVGLVKQACASFKQVLLRQRAKAIPGDVVYQHYTKQLDMCDEIGNAAVFQEGK